MNPTLKNWFTLSLRLGVVYTILLGVLLLCDAPSDTTILLAWVCNAFLLTGLFGEIVELFVVLYRAHKAQKVEA